MTLSVYSLLKRPNRRPFYVLEIDGLGVRFYGPDGPTFTSATYSYRRGIERVTADDTKISLLGGVEEGGTVEVLITDTHDNQAAATLMRLGSRGADRRARLATSIPKEARGVLSALPAVEVEGTLAGWPSSGVFWVGQEAIAYTGISESGGVWSFTGLTRGYYDSQTQRHDYAPSAGLAPWVTDACVNWRTRRARLRMGWRHEDGSAAVDYWTVCEGFIDRSPEMDGPTSILIGIVPWTHALALEIGGAKAQTQLTQGYHLFSDIYGGAVVYEQRWEKGACIDQDTVPPAALGSEDAAGSNRIHVGAGGVGGLHDAYFDVTLATTHPRRGRLEVHTDQDLVPTGYGTAASGEPYIDLSTGPSLDVIRGSSVRNEAVQETYIVPIAGFGLGDERLLRWPDDVLDILNADADVSTTSGAAGRWARIQWVDDIDWPDGGRGPALVGNLNSSLAPAGALSIRFVADHWNLWFGLDPAAPDDPLRVQPPVLRGQPRPRRDGPSEATAYFTHELTATDEAQQVIPLRALATAYWQTSEPYLLCDDNVVGVPSTSYPRWIRVEFQPQDPDLADIDGGRAYTYLEIDEVTQVTADGVSMWRYRTTERSRVDAESFGDFPDGEQCIIRPVARFDDASAPDVMLTLLLSDQGDGTNSPAYDSAPFGVGLTPSEVDIESFQRFPVPGPLRALTLDIVEGRPALDYLRPILQRMGAAVVMKNNPTTGARRLTLVALGPENALDAIGTITADDWVDEAVKTTTDEEIVNRFVYKTNYNWRTREFDLTVTLNDTTSQSDNNEIHETEAEIFGLYLPRVSPAAQQVALRSLFNTQRAMMGTPRRVWTGVVSQALTLGWFPGATVIVNVPEGKTIRGREGVSGVAARIQSIRQDSMENLAEITLVSTESRGTGWAPSLRSSSAGTLTEIIVNANTFTATTHPNTGGVQRDLGYLDAEGREVLYFRPGDVVLIYPSANFAARVTRTITAVDFEANTITVDSAVSVSVGDYMRPASYDSASAHHKAYAYLAGADGSLGADSDPAQEWS